MLIRSDIETANGTGNERTRVPDHVDVDEDEAGLGGGGVEAILEGTDEAQVGVFEAGFGVGEVVVEEGV